MSWTQDEIREAAESDLLAFIRLIAPHRVLGSVHEEVIRWWNREGASKHQIVLLPRDHQKSALMAYRVAWEITRNPDMTVLYISATSRLAEKQLKMIKDIFTSKIYRKYWPEMVNKDEGKREKWTSSEISVDHPVRHKEQVRDATITAAGLTTNVTGLHCNIAVLDDIVVAENAYTEEGRENVRRLYSLLSSVETTGAREWIVGTRYHPKDLYGELMELEEDIFNKDGEIIDRQSVYEVFQRQVEDQGDGMGEFLWPRQRRADGKWFGFDPQVLATKRAKYLDRTQFRAQYYNDPNDPDSMRVDPSKFQYYDRRFIERTQGKWYYKGRPLNVFASIDFAFSRRKKADYTAIVVIGVDPDFNIYVLDIDRFKTDRISEYFDRIKQSHVKWDFRKIRAEVTVAQQSIVRELKEQYIKPHGLFLSVEEHRPSRHQGSKEERIAAVLEPKYDNMSMWHYKGGLCQTLEEELVLENPPHDDMKDALASAVEIATPPKGMQTHKRNALGGKVVSHPRFGGVGFGV